MDEADLNAITDTDTDALRALVREQMAKISRHQETITQHELTIARRDHEIAYKTAKIDNSPMSWRACGGSSSPPSPNA